MCAISLWETSNVFKEDHWIRLEISSSDFPRYARNLKHGEAVREECRIAEGAPDDPSQQVVSVPSGAAGFSVTGISDRGAHRETGARRNGGTAAGGVPYSPRIPMVAAKLSW